MSRYSNTVLLVLILFVTLGCDTVSHEVRQTDSGIDTVLVYVQRQPPSFVEKSVYVQSLARRSRTLIVEGSLAQWMDSPLWSPTGRHIAFRYFVQSDTADVCDSCTTSAGGTFGLAVTSADGSDFRLLDPHAYLVSWLPEGDRLSYAAALPGAQSPRQRVVYIADVQAGTKLEVARIDKSASVLAWDIDGRGFYTTRYNWTLHANELLFVNLQAGIEPAVLGRFTEDNLLAVSRTGDFVLLERQITPWGAQHYVKQLIKYNLETKSEAELVTAWDFILVRLMDDDRLALVSHPTANTDIALTSIYDWEVRHQLLDLENGKTVLLPELVGTGAMPLQVDVIIKD